MNDDKTEFIIFQSRHHNQKIGTCHLDLGAFVFQPSNAVRNLGAFFDANMTMNYAGLRKRPPWWSETD